MKKRILAVLMTVVTAVFAVALEIPETPAIALVKKMGAGWNLGNTLDANPLVDNFLGDRSKCNLSTETAWGMPKTTEEMIKTVAASGIKTIRIPVSWSDHIVNPEKNYNIDAAWMKRVKQVVDWALKYDMYVIINIHHDTFNKPTGLKAGYGYYPAFAFEGVSSAFVTEVWKQVAKAFKDYDERLIFETLNEPRLRGDAHEWNFVNSCKTCQSSMAQINKLNQVAVDTIRKAGGKNAKRLIMVPSYVAAPGAAIESSFKMPADSANMTALSIHMYQPYPFAMQNNASGGTSTFTDAHKADLLNTFNMISAKYIEKGIPVIIGEYGATNKDNLNDRVEWFKFFVSECTARTMVPCLWDNMSPLNSDPQERFGFFNREKLEWYFPEILDAIVTSVSK